LIFEKELQIDVDNIFKRSMSSIFSHILRKVTIYKEELKNHVEEQGFILLDMFKRIYGKKDFLRMVKQINYRQATTIVHEALQAGLYRLVIDGFICDLGFDVDFQAPGAMVTLLHIVAKHRIAEWNDQEREHIMTLITMSRNLDARNNFGSTFMRTAKSC